MKDSQARFRLGVDIGGTYVNDFDATCRLPYPSLPQTTIFHNVTSIQPGLTYRR